MSWLRMLSSHFDGTILLLPIAFMYVGTTISVLVMLSMAFFAVFASRALVEAIRLKPYNYSLSHPIELETLLTPFTSGIREPMMRLPITAFILMQQVSLTMVVALAALKFDHVLVELFKSSIPLSPSQDFYTVIGAFPAQDDDGKVIEHSDLLQLSCGFLFVLKASITCATIFACMSHFPSF